MKTAVIIGAGPVGSYAAMLLARQGLQVDVYEEHEAIGRPVQCTGIVTHNLKDLVDIPSKCIVNRLSKVKVFSGYESASFNLKQPELVLDRESFDKHIAKLAEKEGASFHLGKKIDLEELKQAGRIARHDHVIGADGALSQLSEKAFRQKHPLMIGAQAICRLKCDPYEYKVFLGKRYGSFGWLVPESRSRARIGVMARWKAHSMMKGLLEHFPEAKVVKETGGPIPMYRSSVRTQRGRIYLVGDAAAQVKNSTGGGLFTGMTAAQCLAEAVSKNMSYERLWHKRIGKQLWTHHLIHRAMSRFRQHDHELLVRYARRAKPAVERMDRDRPLGDLLRVVLAEPRLLRFLPRLSIKSCSHKEMSNIPCAQKPQKFHFWVPES
ncbi:MAG: NAD(P)/FAD-dependent oxidoreductase [Nanoarchaeota archaeon]|nr:NAD(P)/FAD-dependent oxidoreductase [Nanoarchaeota archaeon]